MRKIAVFCLLCLFFSLKIDSQRGCCQDLSADQLIDLAIIRAKENDNIKQKHLEYNEHLILEELSHDNKLLSTRKSSSIINQKRSKIAGFDLSLGELLAVLKNRHKFSFASPREITLDNRNLIILLFEPRSGLKSITTEDKFINRLRGKIFIDSSNNNFWRAETEIKETDKFEFRAWLFIFFADIEVKKFKLTFQQIEYNGIMVENAVEVEANFSAIMYGTRTRKYHYEYTDYRHR